MEHPQMFSHEESKSCESGMTEAHRSGGRHPAMVDGGGLRKSEGAVQSGRAERFARHNAKKQEPMSSY